MKTPTTKKTNLTMHRGHARLWLEGKYLAKHGFARHQRYFAYFGAGEIILLAAEDGNRLVSGRKRKGATEWTPIIDISSPEVNQLGSMSGDVTIVDGTIIVKGA